jgi:thiamine biosynthesis lipoprotein
MPSLHSVAGGISRRGFLATPLAALIPTGGHRFHHDHVMGTSLDLVVYGNADADAVHAAVFDEIARLSRILSTYDRDSEISRFHAQGGGACSRDLSTVLRAYEYWHGRTTGAISAHIGEMTGRLNVDALGKAYIADRAVCAAMRGAPGITGVLLNIGGDIVVRGNTPFTISVADPAARADNAPPLTEVRVTDRAVATSGTSERRNHLLDPRAGVPATGAVSATAIAVDGVTANALATALCVLTPQEGMRLVEATPGAGAILIARDGAVSRSLRFAAYEQTGGRARPGPAATNWPPGYEVSVALTLKEIQGFRVHRPYVAVWAEDLSGRLIRNIAVWANKPRWMPELHTWWTRNNGAQQLYSITKPTRPAGRYRILWDGLDEQRQPATAGSYRILVETNREHGDYAKQNGIIDCGAKAARITLKETGEFEDILIEYGPRSAV